MKLENIMPEEGIYNFEFLDRVVEFSRKNGMKLRGHTLVWHNQNREWLFKDHHKRVSKTVLQKRMKEYFNDIMTHFNQDIYAWDVVNEAIDDNSGGFYRKSIWLDLLGENYIGDAFYLAHEINPSAQLFYNDYNETNTEKRKKIYNLIKSLKEQETPIYGIGLQGHWNIYGPTIDEIKTTIEQFAQLDLKIQLTELDLSVFEFHDHRTDVSFLTPELNELQECRYEQIFNLLREYKDEIDSVTFWGVADDDSWLDNFPVKGRKNWPLVFDTNAIPKSAYYKITKFDI